MLFLVLNQINTNYFVFETKSCAAMQSLIQVSQISFENEV